MCCGTTQQHHQRSHHSSCGCGGSACSGPFFWSKKKRIRMLEHSLECLRERSNDVEELLKESACFFFGRHRAWGQGEVELKLASHEPVEHPDWEEWNRSCCKTLEAMLKEQVDGCFFSLGLLSDAIIIDQFLRYTSQPDLQLEGAELITSIMRQGLAIGWNQAHRLPKEDEITITRGSVFFYRYPGDINEIKEQLKVLQTHGIGLRRNEGFGQIIINDPFHSLFCINMEEGK